MSGSHPNLVNKLESMYECISSHVEAVCPLRLIEQQQQKKLYGTNKTDIRSGCIFKLCSLPQCNITEGFLIGFGIFRSIMQS